jgi:formylglycine-generating enzyme required for sulfatase activity
MDWNTLDTNHTNVNCNWTANGFRLPTEAEWEFAARGGNQTHNYTYSGSNDVNSVAWYSSNSGSQSHSVGGLAANELGLFDMSGNVREWVWDIYGSYPSGDQTNPIGATSGSIRVDRGGSWQYSASYCSITYRDSDNPGYINNFIGFRVCRISP